MHGESMHLAVACTRYQKCRNLHFSVLLKSLKLTCVHLNPPKYKDTSIYRTANHGPSGVLIMEVSLYTDLVCGYPRCGFLLG